MTHLRRTMRQKAFFRQMDIIPPSPSRHAHRPLCHARSTPLSCPPHPSVIPAVFSGNPVKTVLLQGSIGSHTPRQGKYRRVVSAVVSDGQ